MSESTQQLLGYYAGGGFIVLLFWAASLPDRRLTAPGAHRYLRWTTVAAVVGLLHPAIALAARDVTGQVGAEIPDGGAQLARRHERTTRLVNILAALSVLPALALLALA